MNNFLNTKWKKIVFFVAIVAVIEFSGHGILASLFRFLGSIN
tara:strand:+ start:106 stop:231 length:126 start_codon:yes stop_codon:yes gene_type:complete